MAGPGGVQPNLPESGGSQLAGQIVGLVAFLAAAADAAATTVTDLSR